MSKDELFESDIEPDIEPIIQGKAERKRLRKEAKERILEFLTDNEDQLGGLKADIELFVGKGKKGRGSFRSINAKLREDFLKNTGLSEAEIFKKYKLGRHEMESKIRLFILAPNPEDRLWIKFDETKEMYNVVGIGSNPPVGWDGYLPKESL